MRRGAYGEIDIYNGSADPINLVGDLAGYFTTSTTGQYYHPVNPVQVADTRSAKSRAVASDATTGFSTPSNLTSDNPSLVRQRVICPVTSLRTSGHCRKSRTRERTSSSS